MFFGLDLNRMQNCDNLSVSGIFCHKTRFIAPQKPQNKWAAMASRAGHTTQTPYC